MNCNPIYINIVVEDYLSEVVVRRIIEKSGRLYDISSIHGQKGCSYIDKNINGFNNAAKGFPYLILRDLNSYKCAPELINQIGPRNKHHNLIYRVVKREVESWLLADRQGFSNFFSVLTNRIPLDVESITDPKDFLVSLAKKSRKKNIREDIVPQKGSTAKVGRNYNACLSKFVYHKWNLKNARNNSVSLHRTIECISNFTPVF